MRQIITTINNGVGKIKFNNPKSLNPITSQVMDEIVETLNMWEYDDDVKVIVFTGEGKHFSAGGDIRKFEENVKKNEGLSEARILKAGDMIARIRSVLKPCIAAVNGVAAGAGCSLALACDFRIITNDGKLLEAFINLGLSGDSGSMYLLNRMIGSAKTTEMMMLGLPIKAEEAKGLDIVNKVVDREEFEQEVDDFAFKLSRGPLVGYAKQKDLINKLNFGDEFEQYLKLEAKYMNDCSETEDFKEAVYAFIDKKKPEFKGR